MLIVFYAIVALVVLLLPSAMTASDTLQAFIRAFAGIGAVVGHFAGLGAIKSLSRFYQAMLAVLATVAFSGAAVLIVTLLIVIEPSWTEQFPDWKPLRELLHRNPMLLNFGAGVFSAVALLSLVGLVTAIVPPKEVSLPTFAELDSRLRYTIICAIVAILFATVFISIVVIPILVVQIALVVFLLVFIVLHALNPDYFYRRLVWWLVVSWSSLRFVLVFAAEGTPWGDYFLQVGERMDASVNNAVVFLVVALLISEIVYRWQSQPKVEKSSK